MKKLRYIYLGFGIGLLLAAFIDKFAIPNVLGGSAIIFLLITAYIGIFGKSSKPEAVKNTPKDGVEVLKENPNLDYDA